MTATQTTQQRLEEAEAALHRLMIGASEVSISYEGKSATYTRANESSLRAYIMGLKVALGQPGRRALSVGFGG